MTSDQRDAPKPKRHWYQFSLRGLLIVVTLVAIGFGLIVAPAERQKRAVRAISDVKGRFDYDAPEPNNGLIHSPQWLRELLGDDYYKSIIVVNLRSTRFTDDGLAPLESLAKLKELDLRGTRITDAGLEYLQGLSSLKVLDLSDTQVSDTGLERLKGLPALQTLLLGRTPITDAGLAHLKGLTKLSALYLEQTRISDAGLTHLKELTELRWLDVTSTKISDAGLEQLRASMHSGGYLWATRRLSNDE